MLIQKYKNQKGKTTITNKLRTICALLTLFALVPLPASAETVTHTKHVDVWYGSVTGTGCPGSLDGLEATTHITDSL